MNEPSNYIQDHHNELDSSMVSLPSFPYPWKDSFACQKHFLVVDHYNTVKSFDIV